jgi:hypothetical protein
MTTATLTTRTAPDADLWGACRVCKQPGYTLTDTRRLPQHPIVGYGPGRPDCRGSHQHPIAGSVTEATWFGAESANYQPIRESAAGRR